MLPIIAIVEYEDESGRRPFERWFDKLNATAAAKVTTALARIEQGNFSNVEGAGGGIYEYKINFGPGYRIYFGKDGATLVILLAGGVKKRQQADIEKAKALWSEYKRRKKQETT